MDITTAMSALGAAIGLAKSAFDARDEARVNAALADIRQKQLELSMSALQLAEKTNSLLAANADLENEVRTLKRKDSERENYALHAVAPGRFVYRFNPADDSGEPVHDICQLCYDQGIKSVLRLNPEAEWTARHYACAASEKGTHDLYF